MRAPSGRATPSRSRARAAARPRAAPPTAPCVRARAGTSARLTSGSVPGLRRFAPPQVGLRAGEHGGLALRPQRRRRRAPRRRTSRSITASQARARTAVTADDGDARPRASELLGDPRRLAAEQPARRARRSTTKIAIAGIRCSAPPAAAAGPGAVGSTIHLRASSSSGASGFSRNRSRSVPGHLLDRIQHRASRRTAPSTSTVQMIAMSRKRGYSDETIIDDRGRDHDQRHDDQREQEPRPHRRDAVGER